MATAGQSEPAPRIAFLDALGAIGGVIVIECAHKVHLTERRGGVGVGGGGAVWVWVRV